MPNLVPSAALILSVALLTGAAQAQTQAPPADEAEVDSADAPSEGGGTDVDGSDTEDEAPSSPFSDEPAGAPPGREVASEPFPAPVERELEDSAAKSTTPPGESEEVAAPFMSNVLAPGLIGLAATMAIPAGAVALGAVGLIGTTQRLFPPLFISNTGVHLIALLCLGAGSVTIGPAGFLGSNLATASALGLAAADWTPLVAGLTAGIGTFVVGGSLLLGALSLSQRGAGAALANVYLTIMVSSVGCFAVAGPISLLASFATELFLSNQNDAALERSREASLPRPPRVAQPTRF